MLNVLAFAFALALVPGQDGFAPVRFLAGQWHGEAVGKPGKGTVERSYTWVLGGHFLHEQNTSTYAPAPGKEKGEVHVHESFLSYDSARKVLVLRQFHQEGFVNQYTLAASGPSKTLAFEQEALENVPVGWKAREKYEIVSNDEFVETFEIAARDTAWQVYSRTRFRRVPPKLDELGPPPSPAAR